MAAEPGTAEPRELTLQEKSLTLQIERLEKERAAAELGQAAAEAACAAMQAAHQGELLRMRGEVEKAGEWGKEAVGEVEAVILRRVEIAALRVDDLARRLKNARFVSEASERMAAEAVVGRHAAERDAALSSRDARRLDLRDMAGSATTTLSIDRAPLQHVVIPEDSFGGTFGTVPFLIGLPMMY